MRTLHFVNRLLPPSETFVQRRLQGRRSEPWVLGWERVADGLEPPCPSAVVPLGLEVDGVARGIRGPTGVGDPWATDTIHTVSVDGSLQLAFELEPLGPEARHLGVGDVVGNDLGALLQCLEGVFDDLHGRVTNRGHFVAS